MDTRLASWRHSSLQFPERFIRVQPGDDDKVLNAQVFFELGVLPVLDEKNKIPASATVLDQHATKAKGRQAAIERWRGVETPVLARHVIFTAALGGEGDLLVRFKTQIAAVAHVNLLQRADAEGSWWFFFVELHVSASSSL